MHLSVITATRNRPGPLAHTLQQLAMQSRGNLSVEHLVVSDGPDSMARVLASRWKARYFELPTCRGHAGAFAKDLGIQQAQGEYVCFWDDDNMYSPHALLTLYAAAYAHDIGVVQVQHRLRKRAGIVTIPRRWSGEFVPGDVDTMCFCVKRTLAIKECWGDENASPGTDFRWVRKLVTHQPAVRFVPVTIGLHL